MILVFCYKLYALFIYKIRILCYNEGTEKERGGIHMANKRTVALTKEQYKEIIQTMRSGFSGFRPNERVATALVLEANLGLRISDILNLHLRDIIKDGDRYRLDICEQKTGKYRNFTVPLDVYIYIQTYCINNGIKSTDLIFPIKERVIQKQLKIVCDWLGYTNIGTHSFRKFFATEIYKDNDYNIVLVQNLLQHSSAAITQRYIGISQKQIEDALEKHIELI